MRAATNPSVSSNERLTALFFFALNTINPHVLCCAVWGDAARGPTAELKLQCSRGTACLVRFRTLRHCSRKLDHSNRRSAHAFRPEWISSSSRHFFELSCKMFHSHFSWDRALLLQIMCHRCEHSIDNPTPVTDRFKYHMLLVQRNFSCL